MSPVNVRPHKQIEKQSAPGSTSELVSMSLGLTVLPWGFGEIVMKNQTLGKTVLKSIRTASGAKSLTDFYWGTAAEYSSGKYHVWDYCPKFGGMRACNERVITSSEIAPLDSPEEIAQAFRLRRDTSPGDPLNYAPHSSKCCELSKEFQSQAA